MRSVQVELEETHAEDVKGDGAKDGEESEFMVVGSDSRKEKCPGGEESQVDDARSEHQTFRTHFHRRLKTCCLLTSNEESRLGRVHC